MLIGYIENGKAMDKMCEPFFQEIGENVVTEINIFDEENNLILEDDEKILLERKDDKFDVENDWRSRGGTSSYAFEGNLYAGTTIITNKRILHYRVPDPNWAGAGKPHVMGIPDALLAREAKKRGMYEFFQTSLSDVVKVYISAKGPRYYILSGMDRFRIDSNKKNPEEFVLVEEYLKPREIERKVTKKITEIYYVEPSFFTDIKKHWKRDDLLKKGAKFVKRKKYDKALIQYQQILEIFPDDESTKKKIDILSKAK